MVVDDIYVFFGLGVGNREERLENGGDDSLRGRRSW